MCYSSMIMDISTHDLTKRSTLLSDFISDSQSFQLTTSRRGRRSGQILRIQWLLFQLTTSRRGRRQLSDSQHAIKSFQLTTSRRGRLINLVTSWSFWRFQLTTSRRGRRRSGICPNFSIYFNSRPHEEVDVTTSPVSISVLYFNSRPHEEVDGKLDWHGWRHFPISTHDLTKRSTLLRQCTLTKHTSFNSRPHEEVDLLNLCINLHSSYFNSRPHEEVDPIIGFTTRDKIISTHDLTKRST